MSQLDKYMHDSVSMSQPRKHSELFGTHAIREAARSAVRRLGYAEIKLEQLKVVETLIQGCDVFAILPTGYGKSLWCGCFPLVYDENELKKSESEPVTVIVVVTPLTAIMKNQVYMNIQARALLTNLVFFLNRLQAFHQKACPLHVYTADSDDDAKKMVLKGMYSLVFFTPEMPLTNNRWRRLLCSDLYSKTHLNLSLKD